MIFPAATQPAKSHLLFQGASRTNGRPIGSIGKTLANLNPKLSQSQGKVDLSSQGSNREISRMMASATS